MSIFPTRILFATDGSEDSELAATTAVGLAKITGSELHVLHVGPAVPEHFESTDVEPGPIEREAQRILDEQVKKIENVGGTVAQGHLRMGGAAEEVIELAEELSTGLIVLGSRGRGRIRRLLMGSVSDSVVRHAHCPVLVVRWKPVVFPAKILLATDGSEEAALAARTAVDLANKTDSELHVVNVGLQDYGYPIYAVPELEEVRGIQEEVTKEARKLLDAEVEQVEAAGGSVAKAHLGIGRPEVAIVKLAEEIGAGLIVMGSRGRGRIRRTLMGSVSDSVVRYAHCPVMVVRREDR